MTRNSIIKLALFSFFLSLVLMSISYADEEPPVASFEASVLTGYIPFEVQFTDLSTGEITSWEWDFGDFTDIVIDQQPTHVFDMPGDFEVTLTVTNLYGSSSTSMIIDADVDLIASFTSEVTPDTFPVDVYFNDTSEGDVVSWEWDFDNDSVIDSTEQYPKHTYTVAGTYLVSLTVTDYYDEVDTITDIVVIESQPPVADFSSNVIAGTAPLQVQFTNESTGDIDLYEWDFDNDGIVDSTDINPINDFDYTGFYTVRLKVTGPLGINEIVKDEYISVYSGTIEVTSGVNTIQDAINLASNGYRILVHDGTYTGAGNKDIDFGGKAIHVVSENGAENTIIDIQNSGRGFYFHSSEGPSSVLEGFSIINGNESADNGGGIKIVAASPTIKKCFVKSCTAINGGGIVIDNLSSPLFEFCLIENNSSTLDGSGVYINDNSAPILRNCIVRTNIATRNGSVYICNQSDVSLQGLLIVQNSATGNGAGIYCDNSSPICYNCTIADNTSSGNGGGMYLCNQSAIILNNTILWSNDAGASCYGNQIYFNDASSFVNAYYSCYDSNSNDPNNINGAGTFTPDTNSITLDPLFTNPLLGEYHLVYDESNPALCSPCIDSGNNILVPIPLKFDLNGQGRILDNDGNGIPTVCIGIIEDPSGCHSIEVDIVSSSIIDPKMWNLDDNDKKFIFKYEIKASLFSTCGAHFKGAQISRITGSNPGIIASTDHTEVNSPIKVDINACTITWNCKCDTKVSSKYVFANPGEYKILVYTECDNPITIFTELQGFYITRLGIWGIEGGTIGDDEKHFFNAADWMPLFYWNKDDGTQGPYRYTLFQLIDKGSTSLYIGSGDDSHGDTAEIPEPDAGFDSISLNDWKDKHNLPIVCKCAETGSTSEDKYSIELRAKLVDKCRSQENTLHTRILVQEVLPKDIKMKITGDLTMLCGKGNGTKVDIKEINYTLNNIVKLKPLILKFPKLPFAYYKLGLKCEWSYNDTPIPGYQETAHTIYLLPHDSNSDFNWDFSYLRASELSSKNCRPADWDKRHDTGYRKSHQNVPWARVLHDVCRWSEELQMKIENKDDAYKVLIHGFWKEATTKSITYDPGSYSFGVKDPRDTTIIKGAKLKKYIQSSNTTICCIGVAALTTVYFQMIGCKEVHPVYTKTTRDDVDDCYFIPSDTVSTDEEITNHFFVTPSGGLPEKGASSTVRNTFKALDACIKFKVGNSKIWADPLGLDTYNGYLLPSFEINKTDSYYQDAEKKIEIDLSTN